MDAAVGVAQRDLDGQVDPRLARGQLGVHLLGFQRLAILQHAPVVGAQLRGRGGIEHGRVVMAHHLAGRLAKQLERVVVGVLVAVVPALDVDEGTHAVEDGGQLLLAVLQVAGALLHLTAQHQRGQGRQQAKHQQPAQAPPHQGRHAPFLRLHTPAAQHLGIGRVGAAAPVLHRAVDGRQHLRVAPGGGGKKQRGGLKHDARVRHAVADRVEVAKQVVGNHRIGLATLHQCKGFDQARGIHQRHLDAKTVHHVEGGGALHRALEHRHPLALQVKQRVDRTALRPVDLRPAVQHRQGMEVVQRLALGRTGHIGHQVKLPGAQGRQAVLPVAGHKLQSPLLTRGHQLQQVHKNARGLAVLINKHLGFVGVHPHPQLTRRRRRTDRTDAYPQQ